jgi:hypothetical protein
MLMLALEIINGVHGGKVKILLVLVNILLLLLLSSQVPFSHTIDHPVGDRNDPNHRIEITSDPSPSPGLGRRITTYQPCVTFVKGLVSRTASVPEPVIIFSLGLGMLGVGIVLRKKSLNPKDK